MPTPYGSRGGMAFGPDELSVLRSALAFALHPVHLPDEDVQACLRLAESVDEAVEEAGRHRAFLLADLARYRAALPGSAVGYLELLQETLAAGARPQPDDLAALRALRGNALAGVLLKHCEAVAGRAVRARPGVRPAPRATVPGSRARLFVVPSGLAAGESSEEPKEPREPRRPAPPKKRPPAPGRPVPKPSEVFPPRRRPKPPPDQLAVS